MQKLVREYLNEMKSRQRKRRRTGIAAILLIVMVVGGMIGVLTQYGVAMTGNMKCGMDEHQHNEACYSSETACGLQEQAGHTHTEACYQTETTLNCAEEESAGHTHADECYGEDGTLLCGQEESEGHTHTEECYQTDSVLLCGQEESEGHTHTAECIQSQLACGKEEHTHTDQCYIDTEAGVEDTSVWEAQYKDTEWKDVWGEDLVTAAQKQIGYKENSDNYTIAEDGSRKGYTRYGQFAGDVYADWDAAFVNFCMYYAGMKDSNLFPDETDTEKWCEEYKRLHEQNAGYLDYLISAEGYTPKEGDIIFFKKENEETEKQMGIVSSYNKEKDEIEVIEGNSGNEVKENEYQVGDEEIVSYLKIAELEKVYKKIDEVQEAETEPEKSEEEITEPQQELVRNSLAQEAGEDGSSDIPEFAASIPVDGSGNGKMILELRYGDKNRHDEKEAEVQSPHVQLNGYFELYSKDIEGNLAMEDLKITLHFPKKYIDPKTIGIEPFTNPEHEISEVRENGEYYEIDLTFPKYEQTGQMQYEFHMNFYGGIVSADYDLKVYATISSGGEKDDTAKNTYRPKYKKPRIIKYVNTNQYDSMEKDYTRVAAKVGDDGVISDNDYVSFWYKLGGEKWYFREYDQTVLTDTLPTYDKCIRDDKGELVLDENGKPKTEEAIAYFDPDENEAWTLSEDGKTVSCKLTTSKSCTHSLEEDGGDDDKHWRAATDLENKINATELKLKFPDCLIDEEANDGFLKKDLLNAVQAEFHPHDPSESEENDIAEDELWFTLTNQPSGAGFAKYNSSNVVMDTQTVREGLYKWGIRFTNEESKDPLTNIEITDFELDERLKIHTLRLEKEGDKDALSRVDRVEVLTYDGETDIYKAEEFKDQPYDHNGFGWCQDLKLDPEKEYKEFTVYMKDDFGLSLNEKIHIGVYTTFREPDKRHYISSEDRDDPRNVYHNGAEVDYKIDNIFYNIVSGNQFSMIDTSENISISKALLYGNQVSLGDTNKYWDIRIKGSLRDGKDYNDMRIVELLPEVFTLPTNDKGEREVRFGVNGDCVKRSEIIDNYKNTGRTAVIMYLNVAKVREILDAPLPDGEGKPKDYVSLTLITNVLPDARVGTFENEVWLLSDDFETVTSQEAAEDIYDVDDDGNTKEWIRRAKAECIVKSPSGIYAEKMIAPTGSDTWRKTDLYLGVGDTFRYKLCVINAAETNHKGLLVYDVLPTIGDKNISNNGERGSEYAVKLSDQIVPSSGYQVYYTTSKQVYKKSMAEILGNGLSEDNESYIAPDPEVEWMKNVTDEQLEQITAFKIVADNDEVVIPAKGSAEFEIPVKVTDRLDKQSYQILENKESVNRPSGTATYLVSTNSFGYRVKTFSGSNLESNYVNAQIPFAGFAIQKVDSNDKDITLANAEFTLEKKCNEDADATEPGTRLAFLEDNAKLDDEENVLLANGGDTLTEGEGDELLPEPEWEFVDSGTSDGKGKISFKNLAEGTYRLTETKAPEGYHLDSTPYIIEVCLDRNTMEYSYTVTRNGESVKFEGSGNSNSPFKITNRFDYELPSTGGMGVYWYMFGGMLLMLAAALITYRNKCKEVLRS